MKILFIGTVEFSARALEKLLQINADIVGIVTRKESKINSDFIDLSPMGKEFGIPTRYTKNINDTETLAWIRELDADILMCFGWSELIKKELLEIPPMGVVGFHPALLPNNRGRHPLIWAKILGLEKSGNTFFLMDEGADTGDILSQRSFVITENDDARSLYKKMVALAMIQIPELHEQLKSGDCPRYPQFRDAGNYWRKRTRNDGLIDFRMSTQLICNLVRALTKPYAGAHLSIGGNNYSVWKVEKGERLSLPANIEPGKILRIEGNKIEVKTGNGSVWLVDHEIKDLELVGRFL